MKEAAERSLNDFKDGYIQIFNASKHSISTEALALGVDTATAYNYLAADVSRNLPAGLIPRSAFAHELMDYLSAKCGGIFVPIVGNLKESDRDEFASILRDCSRLVRENDPEVRLKIFKNIETHAARASVEDGVKKA